MCPPPDHTLAELARSQWGVVARRQLAEIGVTSRMVDERVARGQLVRLHRGVYAVGHARLTPNGFRLAAVLAVPEPAALSHRSAAGFHQLLQAGGSRIDVTTGSRRAADRPGVVVHRSALGPLDRAVIDTIPVTTVARTLVDLATVVPPDQLFRALNEAIFRRVFDLRAIEDAMVRTRGRHGRGHATLRAMLERLADRGARFTRSELEARFRDLIDRHDLPPASFNHHVGGREIDVWWPRHRVAVELDGWAAHGTRVAFQRDREKGNALALAGITLLRFTYTDVCERPTRVIAALRRALGA